MKEQIFNAQTKQDRIIFPNTLNDHNTLFGGIAMQWMDEVAYITAIRFVKKKMVTVSVEKIQFLAPIAAGTIVEVVGTVEKVGSVKIMIQVEILAQDMITGIKTTATRAMFTFAAVDEANRPIPIELKKHVDEISRIVC